MLCYLGCRQKSAVARLCTLADLDEDSARICYHMRHGLDDTVPAEMTGGNLDEEIFQILGFEQLDRHTAFTGAHADRQAAFLIEIRGCKGHSLPGTGGKSADGHIGKNQWINPVNRRRLLRHYELSAFHLKGQLMR